MQKISQYLDKLYKLERTGIKYNLSNIRFLLGALGNPHRKLNFIHIAGTNGKGGTASFLASILMEHGLRTGLFTSPHILKFNERIRINGKPISNNYIKKFLNKNSKLLESVKPSFFEVNTALALKYFEEKVVDIAVLETGLGGRLDSTNIINPELCIITQIAADHTEFLGNSITDIAAEKLGIVKKNVEVIVSDANPALKPFFISHINSNFLCLLDRQIKIRIDRTSFYGTDFTLRVKSVNHRSETILKLHSPLPGEYQARNSAAAVLAAIKYLGQIGKQFSLSKIKAGIKKVKQNTGYRGRFEVVKKNGKSYIFDVSHNPDGIRNAVGNLGRKKVNAIIFAMMGSKDYGGSIAELLPYSDNIIFTKPEYKRAIDPEILFNYAEKLNIHESQAQKTFFCSRNVKDALRQGNGLARKNGFILIIGSFFLVSDAIKVLRLQKEFK
jgi:dihydrofolate synthase/folylpolyglutamate synthase